jgi:hypothetical protein
MIILQILTLNLLLHLSDTAISNHGKISDSLVLIFIAYSEVLNKLFDIQMSTGEQMDMEVVNLNGRMDLEREDYQNSQPNNRHIPRNPGIP